MNRSEMEVYNIYKFTGKNKLFMDVESTLLKYIFHSHKNQSCWTNDSIVDKFSS
jgi:hypothetical protein